MKKTMAFLLALALACSLCVPALAAEADEAAGPTLTLVVNGVASEAAITAGEGVTYADAAALRDILGGKAVAPTYKGPVPVREAAENAGWEVQWYAEGLDQQVCLWNKEVACSEMEAQFGPAREFFNLLRDTTLAKLNSPAPRKASEITNAQITTFSTLDGNQTYLARERRESVWQNGVVDGNVMLNLAGLETLLTAHEFESLAQAAGMDATAFRRYLSGVTVEYVLDVNAGGIAVNAPILALFDPELAGWHSFYFPDLMEGLAAGLDISGMLYDQMRADAQLEGGIRARETMDRAAAVAETFLGADRFHAVTDGNWTYTLTTQQANAAMGQSLANRAGAEVDTAMSWYKNCEITVHLDKTGKMDLTVALRPDAQGSGKIAAWADEGLAAVYKSLRQRLTSAMADVDVKISGFANKDKSEATVELHWNNLGQMKLTTTSDTVAAGSSPRQLAQVERTWVENDIGGGDKS